MEIPLHDYGAENFYQARIVPAKGNRDQLRQSKVALRSLDSLFSEIRHDLTFIKCDVEGHELAVIKGASQLLERMQPAWLVEVSGSPDDATSPSHRLFEHLRQANYGVYWFDGRILRRRVPGDRAVNYFFLQPGHLARLGALAR